jgi:hypothetical protein
MRVLNEYVIVKIMKQPTASSNLSTGNMGRSGHRIKMKGQSNTDLFQRCHPGQGDL